jgi:DNA-3-methyladenine glycosylase I
VRNRAKVAAAISNAHAFLEVVLNEGSFDRYIWQFVGGEPIQNRFKAHGDIPAETAASRAMSVDLKARGFRFVGPTICYAYMQAAGLVNDHVTSCFRHEQVRPS